ncbi:Clr5 domain-containing protein [Lasiosphaeria ovina]|uniref:Clr5 domain-containing protein n=1 Tax=Lasiosphaeria ovina TaxID=92902 RepID=A0AAE0KHB9_9PEZI|nr:Clr5 domain-containing protein [Lasiosphaeria ovina]
MEYRWGDRELSPTFLDLALDTAHVGPSSAGQEHLDAHDPAENNAATAKEPEDIDMADLGTNNRKIPEAEDDSSTPKVNLQQQPHPKAHGRSKYKGLDWDTHKPMMKTLYMDKDMSLTDTMGVMERECSFKASQKAYKEQFDSWQWKKKLPKEIAQYMVEKDKKRKRQGKKGTVYKWGGRKWTDADTPDGVTYRTPTSATTSPNESDANNDIAVQDIESEADSVKEASAESWSDTDVAEIHLSYKGKTRTDLLAMREFVRTRGGEISQDKTEEILNDVLDGLEHLQGATNEQTNKVAYELADLYFKTKRPDEADKLLERQTQAHINILGYEHRKTCQHILHVLELLNGWGRHEDALGLLHM